MRSNRPAIGVSKRALGFPIKLSLANCFVIHQIYPWLQSINATDELMDQALELLPKWDVTQEHVKQAAAGGRMSGVAYSTGFYKNRTVRIRATHLEGMIRLLRLTAAYAVGGQAGSVLGRRAEDLASVSALDQLADAGR